MELGIKKLSQLNKRNTLNMIGKLTLQENIYHNKIFLKAIELNTPTIKYWRTLLYEINVTDFEYIKTQCDNDYNQ